MRDAEVWVDGVKRSERIEGLSCYTFLNRALRLNLGLLYIDVLAEGWDQSTVHKSFTLTIRTNGLGRSAPWLLNEDAADGARP